MALGVAWVLCWEKDVQTCEEVQLLELLIAYLSKTLSGSDETEPGQVYSSQRLIPCSNEQRLTSE